MIELPETFVATVYAGIFHDKIIVRFGYNDKLTSTIKRQVQQAMIKGLEAELKCPS